MRITFVHGSYEGNYDDYGAGLVEFVMKGNQIDDVRYGGSDNPKKIPTKTERSLKADAQKMVNTNLCAWE